MVKTPGKGQNTSSPGTVWTGTESTTTSTTIGREPALRSMGSKTSTAAMSLDPTKSLAPQEVAPGGSFAKRFVHQKVHTPRGCSTGISLTRRFAHKEVCSQGSSLTRKFAPQEEVRSPGGSLPERVAHQELRSPKGCSPRGSHPRRIACQGGLLSRRFVHQEVQSPRGSPNRRFAHQGV